MILGGQSFSECTDGISQSRFVFGMFLDDMTHFMTDNKGQFFVGQGKG